MMMGTADQVENEIIMEHYLDNSATTKPAECALLAMNRAALVWGNPSSVHHLGQEAASLLRESRKTVAKALGVPFFGGDKIIFTASGTEANNIALLGCAAAKKRNPSAPGTVLLSAGEHPSIDAPANLLAGQGYDVVRIPTRGGVLDMDFLKTAVQEAKSPVVFAAFMLVNNETGAIYHVKEAARAVKAKYPDAVVHCDAVQAFMKLKFTPSALGVDTLTVSAHKIHAIRGAAALYISAETIKRKNVVAVMPGGGQENGFRSGTENLCSIAAFAAAAEEGMRNFDENLAAVEGLRRLLEEKLDGMDVRLNRPTESLPHIVSLTVRGIRSETLLNYLSGRGVYVSAGSACSANSKKKSEALTAFGLETEDIDSTIRVSLSHMNTEDDIVALCEGLALGIASLQRKEK